MSRYPPVGKCIYCGARIYSADDSKLLADEHIIPFAMGGDRVLPQASCRACERITGSAEQIALRGILHGTRMALGLRSRKGHPDALPLYEHRDGDVYRVEVEVENYPKILMLCAPAFLPPILTEDIPDPPLLYCTGGPLDKNASAMFDNDIFIAEFTDNNPEKVFRPDLSGRIPPSLDLKRFFRMMAKAAHAYAIAEFGPDSFDPYLIELILGRADDDASLYIGGPMNQTDDLVQGILHIVSLHFECSFDGICYVVVRIRPFACLGGPTVYVVVGELLIDQLTPSRQARVRVESLLRRF